MRRESFCVWEYCFPVENLSLCIVLRYRQNALSEQEFSSVFHTPFCGKCGKPTPGNQRKFHSFQRFFHRRTGGCAELFHTPAAEILKFTDNFIIKCEQCGKTEFAGKGLAAGNSAGTLWSGNVAQHPMKNFFTPMGRIFRKRLDKITESLYNIIYMLFFRKDFTKHERET